MKKLLMTLLFAAGIYLANSHTTMAADYWVYAQDGCNYYAVTESLTTRKGAYQIDVKEVGPNGSCFRYGLEFYNNGRGIVYNRTPVRAGNSRMSNGHDLIAALWQYATTHSSH